MDIRSELSRLPPPDPGAPDRVWARFRARRERRSLRWLVLAPALATAAAAFWVASRPLAPREVPLVAPDQVSRLDWSEQVSLSFTGSGVAAGTAKDVSVRWESGELRAEVVPGTGTALRVLTEEAEVRVVGTALTVVRDRLGVTTSVQHGEVAVRCADGWTGHLTAETGPVTCLPVRPALLLGRADALLDRGDPLPAVLDALDRGLAAADPDGSDAVVGELLARRMVVRRDLGRTAEALADADAYLALGGGRADEVHRLAAWLLLAEEGCGRARHHLEAVAPRDGQAAVLLAECVVVEDPERARSLVTACWGSLDEAWRERARPLLAEAP